MREFPNIQIPIVKKKVNNLKKEEHCKKKMDRIIEKILTRLPRGLHQDIHYLFKGKRIRSSLMFSLGSHLGFPLDQIVLPAVGVEIVHTISLIHDDVIDQQLIRRGQSTLHRLYGNRVAVFIGDFLLHCLGEEMVSNYQGSKVIESLYRKIAELCRGEVLQDIPTGIISPGRHEYLQMIRQKTGSLFSYSFMVPVVLSGKNFPEVICFAEECGYLFGLNFQLADDLADITEDVEVIRNEKKNREGDSPERFFSYPILLWQEMDPIGFKDYFHKPSLVQLRKVKKRIYESVYAEINSELNHLEMKSKKYGKHAGAVYEFLKKEVNRLSISFH